MIDHVPEQTRKNDEDTLKVLGEHVAAVEAFVCGLEEKQNTMYSGEQPFNADSHQEVSYQISKLKLIGAAFRVHIDHIKACQDVEGKVFKRLYDLKVSIEEINERSTGKYWWNKFKWFGESARTVVTTIASVGILYAAFASGFLSLYAGP